MHSSANLVLLSVLGAAGRAVMVLCQDGPTPPGGTGSVGQERSFGIASPSTWHSEIR